METNNLTAPIAVEKDRNTLTIELMNRMKLHGMARGLDRNQMERLASLEFIRKGQNLFITGSSGTGKSFLATAMGYEACKKGIRTYYANAPKLMGTLKVAKVKGTLESELKRIERSTLLILDDLFLVNHPARYNRGPTWAQVHHHHLATANGQLV